MSRKLRPASLGLLTLSTAAALSAGCLKKPACREAMEHFYDVNGTGYCVVVLMHPDTDLQTEDEAIDWCYEIEEQADECGCDDEFAAFIDCLQTTRYPDCNDCDTQATALQLCAQCVAAL